MTAFRLTLISLTLLNIKAVNPSIIDLRGEWSVIGKTNTKYASWTIDSSYNRGFVHINFDNANLLAAASSLAPSTIRFGGGGNDYLYYEPYAPCNSSNDYDYAVCLNTTHWNSLYNMANKSESDFIFGLSYDLNAGCKVYKQYVNGIGWTPVIYLFCHKFQIILLVLFGIRKEATTRGNLDLQSQ